MELLRSVNAASPAAAETVTLNQVVCLIGGVASDQKSERFVYDDATMSGGIALAFPVTPGTYPAVYLRGLRMAIRKTGETSGGDVKVVASVAETLTRVSMIVFVGTAYTLADDDDIYVVYFTPSDEDETALFTSADDSVTVSDTIEGSPVLVEIPAEDDALAVVAAIEVTVDGVTKAPADGWTMEVEERELGGVTILALLSVTVAGALITESAVAVVVNYKKLTEV